MRDPLAVLATYRLPFAVAFESECSGVEAPTRIGRFDATVALPQLTWTAEGPHVGPPVGRAPASPEFGEPWGEVDARDPIGGKVDVWWATGLFITLDPASEDSSTATDDLFAAIGLWTERLASWIEATTSQDARRIGPLRSVEVDGEGLTAWVSRTEHVRPMTPSRVTALSDGARPLESEAWTLILRWVGEESDVPDEHRLLCDARAWLRRQDYRRAIIDAASAAELVLTELLDWKLAAAPATLEEQLSPERRTLAQMKDLLAPLVPIDKERLDRFVTTRNAVMHKHQEAKSAEAAEAIAVAQELVALFYPVDTLLGR